MNGSYIQGGDWLSVVLQIKRMVAGSNHFFFGKNEKYETDSEEKTMV